MKIKDVKGITLVSLVITIIIMLILAGVALSYTIGDKGTLEKADEAKLTAEERNKKSLVEQALIKFNSGNAVGSSDFKDFLANELKIVPESIVDVLDKAGEEAYIIKDFQGQKFFISKVDDVFKISMFGESKMSFGYLDNLDSGDRIIALKDGDELEIDKNNYAILNSEDLQNISFDIPANTHVKLKLLSDFTITNQGVQRAAINLNTNSVLDLAVYGNVTVNSTFGENASISANQETPKGGYAGIHVPSTATLNLSGTGTIRCYGGNAGNGGTFIGGSHGGGSGGGGAGAGIGRKRRKWRYRK